ncbi:hypothetical protein [Dokdonella soli]|uniref:DUF1819 family protein n=1 Tax=Dokdonella soli TaxID=529810 RepID=A0ABN1IJC5_9GAMM
MSAQTRTPKEPRSQRKTEALSIRLDQRTKYGLELLGREQRRPVAGVAEWCIWESFRRETVRNYAGTPISLEKVLSELWLSSELERLITLGFIYPSLATFSDDRMFRVLVETPELWTDATNVHSANSFKMRAILPRWEFLKPILVAASEGARPLLPLSREELASVGLSELVANR